MLAIILAEDDAFSRSVSHRSRLQNYSVVRYRDPVKLADNLTELKPDAIIVRAEDFPLHWQILAAELHHTESLQKTRLVVFTPDPAAIPFPQVKDYATLKFIELPRGPGQGALLEESAHALISILAERGAGKHDAVARRTPIASEPSADTKKASSRLMEAAKRRGSRI